MDYLIVFTTTDPFKDYTPIQAALLKAEAEELVASAVVQFWMLSQKRRPIRLQTLETLTALLRPLLGDGDVLLIVDSPAGYYLGDDQ